MAKPDPAPYVRDREDVMRLLWWGGTGNGASAWLLANGEGGHEEINFKTRKFRIELGGHWYTGTYCNEAHHHYDD